MLYLEEVDWSPIYSLRDVNEVCAAFYEKLAVQGCDSRKHS
jgi:hypothetical protein